VARPASKNLPMESPLSDRQAHILRQLPETESATQKGE